MNRKNLLPALLETVRTLNPESVPQERRRVLDLLAAAIREGLSGQHLVRLNFICTHNSRRSHLAQVWAQALAYHFELDGIVCFSSGTEATAMFPLVGATLTKQGFRINRLSEGVNPVYAISFAEDEPPVIGFSKAIDHPFNPHEGFVAVMTCSQADEDCPFVPGAERRISLPYEDPKAFDHSSEQADKYVERSLQIATELSYVFATVFPSIQDRPTGN